VPPSGSVTSHASPTGFASGGRLTARVGQDIAARLCAQRHPLYPRLCSLCLSLLPALGRNARDYSHDSEAFCHKQTEMASGEHERGSGASSPWLKPGVSAPQIR
jgi:hypothetical protein